MIVFDVDGTLIDDEDQPRWDVIDLLRGFHRLGIPIGVWSGGGEDYAASWVRRLGLTKFVSWTGAKSRLLELTQQHDVTLFIDDRPAEYADWPVLQV